MDARGPGSEEAPHGVATSSPVPSTQKNVTSTTSIVTTTPTTGATAQSVVLLSSPPPAPPQTGTPHQATLPRILSRNINGTLVQTSVPQNEAELQLYRVMQRASLLGYYDTLLEMGGDDVQQLCDAGEEEFLEIMALVGMASKPLHVRRLQKALQEWLTNPSLFQTPVVPTSAGNLKTTTMSGFPCISPRLQQANPTTGILSSSQSMASASTPFVATHLSLASLPSRSISPVMPTTNVTATLTPVASSTFRHSPSPNAPQLPSYTAVHSPGILQVGTCESSCGSGTTPSPNAVAPASPPQTTPTLLPSQVQRLADAAERLSASLRPLDPKPHNVKKKICKNLEIVMAMSDSDPSRMEEIRKYAAIYGRFDCKRKPEKPLTLHEVSVNEAAAQICRFVPALLTRRDELFPLARRVVRDSGYHYSKNQYLSLSRSHENGDENDAERLKRQKLDLDNVEGEDSPQVELDLRCSSSEINNSSLRRQRSTSPVWQKKGDNGLFNSNIEEISDSDSQFSFSNEESLSLQDANDIEGEKTDKENENDFNLKVIASRGDNIIAVANPALMNCNRSIKEEPVDEKSVL